MTVHLDNDLSDAEWDEFVERHPNGHILQTSAWAALKSRFGWSAGRVAVSRHGQVVAGATVLFRRAPLGLGSLGYAPKGPVVDWNDYAALAELVTGLDRLARSRRAFALKIEPDLERESGLPSLLAGRSWRPASTVQPPRTVVIDLARSEDEILAAMHQKTRYNVRLAGRKGVAVREGGRGDLDAFYDLMQTTGSRQDFGIHSREYYAAAFDEMVGRGWGRLLLAEIQTESGCQPIAGVMVWGMGAKSWYMYGASSSAHRERMAPYVLQWEAMRWARARGCQTYDMYGVPDEDEASLEAQYLGREDGLWGVYRFKRGFGGRLVRYAGAFDRVYNPPLYSAFTFLVRRRGGLA